MAETREVLEGMYNKLDNFLKTETVIGDPIEIGQVTLIPIISASFGLGGGFGEESKTDSGGGGGGLGCKITPDAVLIVKEDQVEMLPVKNKGSLEKLIEKVPDIISKLEKTKKSPSEESEEEKEEKPAEEE